jgi:hypothetical protein
MDRAIQSLGCGQAIGAARVAVWSVMMAMALRQDRRNSSATLGQWASGSGRQ